MPRSRSCMAVALQPDIGLPSSSTIRYSVPAMTWPDQAATRSQQSRALAIESRFCPRMANAFKRPDYVEAGIRLILQAEIEAFVHVLDGFKGELIQAAVDLNVRADEGGRRAPTGLALQPV